MATPVHHAWFGLNIDPHAGALELAFDLARYADQAALDIIGVQDHPYNRAHLDTWTLLSALGAATSRARLLTNVASLPLRPPAMLAKAAATLDLISGGRVELGLGAGAFWDGIAAYGGPRRQPREAVEALEEAIQVAHLLWGRGETRGPVVFEGTYYRLAGAQPGPPPAHQIGIWLGALKPRMLELTGRLADGWSISHNYVPPAEVPAMLRAIEQAARRAGRDLRSIRRNYNLMGLIESSGQPSIQLRQAGMLSGPPAAWADVLVRFATELGMDTFIYWPVAGDTRDQMRLWAEEVVPLARERLQ